MKKKFTILITAAFMLLTMMARPMTAWGQSTSSLIFTAKCNGSGTADDGATWIVTSDGTESNFDDVKGIHYGTNSAQVKYITLTTSDISGTITSIVVNASTASGVSAVLNVTVGGNAFGTQEQTTTTSAANYTFTGSASGEIVVTHTKPQKAAKALYVKSIVVTYTTGGSDNYSVTYNSNGATSGDVPVDNNEYESGDEVTVLGNTGNLAKEHYTFGGWNTLANGSGTTYQADDTFEITSNTTLYAKWTPNTHNVTLPTANEYGTYTMNATNPVAYGTTVTLIYTPVSGYESYSATWSVNGTPLVGNTFSMPDEDVTVTVALSQMTRDELTKEFIGVGGSYTNWSDKTGASNAIYAGRSLGSSTNPAYIQLNYSTDNSAGAYHSGIITTSSGGTIKKVVVTWATKGYNTANRYLTVYGKNTAYSSKDDLYDENARGTSLGTITYYTTNPETTLFIDGEYKYVGLLASGAMTFDKIEVYWEQIPTYTVSGVADPEEGGSVTVTTSPLEEGGTTQVSATANPGYVFDHWNVSGTGSSLSSTTTNPTTLTMGTADAVVTATFTAVTTYEVAISDGITGGTVVSNVEHAAEGATITLTATPSAGYTFSNTESNWSVVDESSIPVTVTPSEGNTATFTMPARNVTVSATFSAMPVYTVSCTTPENGNLSVSPASGYNGVEVTITATPDAGYKLNTLTATDNDGDITITDNKFNIRNSNVTVEATFVQSIEYTKFTGTLEEGDYVLYYNGYAMKNTIANNRLSYETVTPENDKISEPDASIVWHIAPSGDYWTIYSEEVTRYAASTTNNNQAQLLESGTDDKSLWTVSSTISSTTYDFVNKSNTRYLRNNGTNGFACYASSTGGALTLYKKPCVNKPTFTPAGGVYYETQSVTLSCSTEGATIHYTTDGTTPTSSSATYSEAIPVSATTTIKAIAVKAGLIDSGVATATYTIMDDVEEPVLEGELFTSVPYEVTILVPDGTTVYYTTDGTNPTNESYVYDEDHPFSISATTTVKAIAYDAHGCYSEIVSATYTRTYTLSDAKALYNGSPVSNVTINLAGVQIAAKSGAYIYAQQGNVGLVLWSYSSPSFDVGDNITSGTMTGTITKYGYNSQLSISSYTEIVKTPGTLTASTTGVKITDITTGFSTYESRYIELESLTMSVSGLTLTDDSEHTINIYDPFNVLSGATQPDDKVVVKGIVTSYSPNYQIIPVAKADISTGVKAALPTLSPAGGVDVEHAAECETVTITPATNTSVDYVFGEESDEITTEVVVTVPSTTPTELMVESSRDFYNNNIASYYYKSSLTMYDVTFNVNGEINPEFAKEIVEGGEIGELPEATAPNGFTFMGWAESTISGVQDSAPTMVTEETIVEDDMTLYAVFAIAETIEEEESKSMTLVSTDFSSASYAANNGSHSKDNIGYYTNQVMKSSDDIQFQKSSGYLYNITALNITSIVLTISAGSFTVFEGDSQHPTSTVTDKNDNVYTFKDQSNKYFTIKTGTSETGKIASIVINYTALVSNTIYSNYCTTIAPMDDDVLHLDGDGNLTESTIIPEGTVYYLDEIVTIPEGITLTVNGTFGNSDPDFLVIEDGGQLIHDNAGVEATIKKNITGYGTGTGNYYFLVSPFADPIAPLNVINMIATPAENYDLYQWDGGETLEWRNYKQDQFDLINGKGYLYANKNNVELTFTGALKQSNENITVEPEYNATADFGDWTLVGNPFACNAYLADTTGMGNAFYRMNTAGDGFTAVASGAIAPMEGIFVKASTVDQSFNFTREAPQPVQGKGNLNLQVAQVVNSRDAQPATDNAIIRFDNGNALEKFSFRDNTTKVYIPQGNKDYAVVSAEAQGEMPVNFKAEEDGTYTISFNTENVEFGYLHLIDNKTGNDIDLLQTSSYTFEASRIDYASRFRLVFSAIGNENDSENNDFGFFDANGNFLILGIEGTATLQVMDVTGRTISSETFSGDYSKAINASAGVYMLRLVQGNDVRTQKVVVK